MSYLHRGISQPSREFSLGLFTLREGRAERYFPSVEVELMKCRLFMSIGRYCNDLILLKFKLLVDVKGFHIVVHTRGTNHLGHSFLGNLTLSRFY